MKSGQRVTRSLSSPDTWTTHQLLLVPCTRPLPSPVTLISWGLPGSRDSLRALISPGGQGETFPLSAPGVVWKRRQTMSSVQMKGQRKLYSNHFQFAVA